MDKRRADGDVWANDIVVNHSDPEICAAVAAEMRSKPLPPMRAVNALEPTPEERAVIAACLEATGTLFGMLGTPERTVSPERIILLDEREFRRTIGPRVGGKALYGRVYACRLADPVDLVTVLTHELAHCIGYFVPEITLAEDAATGRLRIGYSFRKSGYLEACGKECKGYGLLLPHYHGLNEATTEVVGSYIRQLYANVPGAPHAKDPRVGEIATYHAAVVLLQGLIEIAADGDDVRVPSAEVLMDHVGGTRMFLDRLERALPGADAVLQRTGATPKEVHASATELGLTRVADAIAPLISPP